MYHPWMHAIALNCAEVPWMLINTIVHLRCVAVCCSMSQHVAACCGVLQCVAVCCSSAQLRQGAVDVD